jgi:hypothetical protein
LIELYGDFFVVACFCISLRLKVFANIVVICAMEVSIYALITQVIKVLGQIYFHAEAGVFRGFFCSITTAYVYHL